MSDCRLAIFLGIGTVASVATIAVPYLGVPLALITTPAVIRARRLSRSPRLDLAGAVGKFLVSVLFVLPIALASGIAFCCICTPTGYASFWLSDVALRATNERYFGAQIIVSLGFAYLLGMVVALEVGYQLLRKFNFMRYADNPLKDPE